MSCSKDVAALYFTRFSRRANQNVRGKEVLSFFINMTDKISLDILIQLTFENLLRLFCFNSKHAEERRNRTLNVFICLNTLKAEWKQRLSTMTKAAVAKSAPDWLFNESDAMNRKVGLGIGSSIVRDIEAERMAELSRNKQLITSLDGPSKRKEYRAELKRVLAEDTRPIFQFFTLLNQKPYKDSAKLKEDKLVPVMKEHPEFCKELYRFEAFHNDLLHPLHMLCALGASTATLKTCLKHCEAAMFHDDSVLGSPMHYACTFNAPFELIRWLVKKDKDSLQLSNAKRMTPLHLACLYGADANTVAFLTDRCPKAATKVDEEGSTALHLACSVETSDLEIVEDLTEVNPEACIVTDNEGSTPLQKALESNADISILKDLIRTNADAVKIANHTGNLPVHTAILSDSDLKVFKLLARKYPEGLEVENLAGDTPHVLAKKMGLDDEISQFLDPYEEVEE